MIIFIQFVKVIFISKFYFNLKTVILVVPHAQVLRKQIVLLAILLNTEKYCRLQPNALVLNIIIKIRIRIFAQVFYICN